MRRRELTREPKGSRKPCVAVVIPAYNHAAYIQAAIKSVVTQDWPDLKVYVLDDGSQDDTASIADATLQMAQGVQCHLASQSNAGSAITLNRLIAGADADYVAILNSDDYYLPGRIRTMMQQATGTPFLAFSGVAFDADAMASPEIGFEDWYRGKLAYALSLPSCGYALLTANLAISSGNFLFSRRLFDDVGGFNADLPLTQDWEFLLKALRFTEPVFVPERLLYYRVHATNSSRQLVDVRIQQSQQAMNGFLQWADAAAGNRLAPTPGTWQRFFPFFARSCAPAFSAEPLAEFLPHELLFRTEGESVPMAVEDLALSNMLSAARKRADNLRKTTDELLLDVAEQWATTINSVAGDHG